MSNVHICKIIISEEVLITDTLVFVLFSHGTKQFSVHVSFKSHYDWTKVLTDNLPDARNKTCEEIPLNTFEVNAAGRFVKIIMESFYGVGPGLKYVNIEYEESDSKLIPFLKVNEKNQFCVYQYRQLQILRRQNFQYHLLQCLNVATLNFQ